MIDYILQENGALITEMNKATQQRTRPSADTVADAPSPLKAALAIEQDGIRYQKERN
jgi:hypothetical protein